MGFFDYFRASKKSTASIARERLQIIVAHQRADRTKSFSKLDDPEFLAKLQQEIMQVVQKYIPIDEDQIKVEVDQNEGCSVLELNVTLADKELT